MLVGTIVNGRQLGNLRNELKAGIAGLRGAMNARFDVVDAKFDALDRSLLRVEGLLDAWLKRLEEARNR